MKKKKKRVVESDFHLKGEEVDVTSSHVTPKKRRRSVSQELREEMSPPPTVLVERKSQEEQNQEEDEAGRDVCGVWRQSRVFITAFG